MLARIALRSLGRFVTSMHKSFPIASATIIRQQAAPGEEEGGVTDLTKEGKDVSGPTIEKVLVFPRCFSVMSCSRPGGGGELMVVRLWHSSDR